MSFLNRLDVELTARGIVKSRNVAQQLIKEGKIYVNGQAIVKSSFAVSEADSIDVRGDMPKYVGRGGLKLEKAVSCFGIDLNDKVCIDVGASTGGFTDCMIQNGARLVYAVDVGSNQLDPLLRSNERVISLEKTDIRTAESKIGEKADFISIDVSFISLITVLPFAVRLLKEDGSMVALIKPQFEVGKSGLGKNGIVKNGKLREKAVNNIKEFVLLSGLNVIGIIESPILGGDGNTEYLMYISF